MRKYPNLALFIGFGIVFAKPVRLSERKEENRMDIQMINLIPLAVAGLVGLSLGGLAGALVTWSTLTARFRIVQRLEALRRL